MDAKSIFNLLKEVSIFDIFLVSFLLLPFIAAKWLDVLAAVSYDQQAGLLVLLIAYVAGVILMLWGSRRDQKYEVAKDRVIAYLQDKNYKLMSFERIQENIDSSYRDGFLQRLPEKFPDQIRLARLAGGKPGLGRIIQENVEAEG